MKLIRIVAPHFVAGIEIEEGRVVRTAPIVKYMKGWNGKQFVTYCQKKRWKWSIV